MLADGEAIASTVRSSRSAAELGVPSQRGEIESVADPKALLRSAVREARSRTRKRRGGIPYEPLGERSDVAALRTLASFARFEADLRQALDRLGRLER